MSYKKAIINGKEVYTVTGVFGTSACHLWDEAEVKDESIKQQILDSGLELFRFFVTEEAAKAYIQGIDDMSGWMDYTLTDPEEHQKVFGILKGVNF